MGMHECKGECKHWAHSAWFAFLIFSVILWGLLVYTQKDLTRAVEAQSLGSSQAYTSAYLDRVEEAVKSTVIGKNEAHKGAAPAHAYTSTNNVPFLDRLGGFQIFLLMLDFAVGALWLHSLRELKCCCKMACGKMKEACGKEACGSGSKEGGACS